MGDLVLERPKVARATAVVHDRTSVGRAAEPSASTRPSADVDPFAEPVPDEPSTGHPSTGRSTEPAAPGRPFVGRAAELAALDRALSGSRTDRVLVVPGEPGIGKTRLLAAFRGRAAARGWAVTAGQGGSDLPFSVFVDALDPLVSPAVAAALPSDAAAVLGPLLPSLRDGAGCRTGPDGRAAVAAFHTLLATVAPATAATTGDGARAGRPLLVLLDDVHRADAASLDLLCHLLRSRTGGNVVVALAYRPRQAPARLTAALDVALEHGLARALPLGPLAEADAVRLVGADVPASDAHRLVRDGAGNPRYLVAARDHAAGRHPAPSIVLGTDLESLPAEARRVAHAAAVLAPVVDPALIAAVAELPDDVATAGLDVLARSDLVRPGPVAGQVTFRHPLVRDAVDADAGPGWRRGAHGRAASALRGRNAPVALWAHHVEQSASIGDDGAVRALVRAAARETDPVTAARFLGTALRLLPDDRPTRARRGRMLLARAEALHRAGDLGGARDVLAAALPLLPARGRRVRSRAVLLAARVALLGGDHDHAAALLRREREVRRHVGSQASRRLTLALAEVAMLAGNLPTARAVLATVRTEGPAVDGADGVRGVDGARAVDVRSVDGARAVDVRSVDGARAVDVRGVDDVRGARGGNGPGGGDGVAMAADAMDALLRCLADEPGAREVAARAGAAVDALPDAAFGAALDAARWAGWAELLSGRYAPAFRRQRRSIAAARAAGLVPELVYVLAGRTLALRLTGRLADARATAGEAVDTARRSGSIELLLLALSQLADVAGWQGDVAAALTAADEAADLARRSGGSWGVLAAMAGGAARLAAGDPAGCVETMLRSGGGQDLTRVAPASRSAWYELLTRAALADGGRDAAELWAQAAERSAHADDRTADAGHGVDGTHSVDDGCPGHGARDVDGGGVGRGRAASDGGAPRPDVPGRVGTSGRTAVGFARLARAHVLLAAGAYAAAALAARGAVDALDATPLDRARAELVAGRALGEDGRRTDALAAVRSAADLFDAAGAARAADEAAHELRRLGQRVPRAGGRGRAGGAGVAALSRREREIADLVTEGRTNRAVAATLYLSEKTIERHLTSIFNKLGVPSRAALAAQVVGAAAGRAR